MELIGPTSQSFVSQRLRLHYVDWGRLRPDGSVKPTLVLVHGGKDHCRSWDWTALALRDEWHVVALDHRGHGDSDWVSDGVYQVQDMVYDLAQLVHQLGAGPVTIISHSMGGNVALRYAGIYPEMVRRIVAIEGLGPSPKLLAEQEQQPFPVRAREWIEKKRRASGRSVRKYATIEDAFARMIEENNYLTEDQARHLTVHGVNRNEDGTFSWKFDPHLNVWAIGASEQVCVETMWAAITCPTLLLYGANSWASNPAKDGRISHFRDAQVIEFENAGHWLHHDQFDRFMSTVNAFLSADR
ncbi:alpha/beta hydrolase [Erythrobacteraceae bacterium CFH 75059]|uniref:alpha/beta fold hydrolase n=1 Tax=Qipengyuania thermophila TaxID=2509361 RepID=UPI001021B0F0|nr:alpha/beta hydrolase [Qipengyuania thermophila]TCD06825.1 alpha/beta hydrolase [Erythrobacteraceae bacterium CFH 75059]